MNEQQLAELNSELVTARNQQRECEVEARPDHGDHAR